MGLYQEPHEVGTKPYVKSHHGPANGALPRIRRLLPRRAHGGTRFRLVRVQPGDVHFSGDHFDPRFYVPLIDSYTVLCYIHAIMYV